MDGQSLCRFKIALGWHRKLTREKGVQFPAALDSSRVLDSLSRKVPSVLEDSNHQIPLVIILSFDTHTLFSGNIKALNICSVSYIT